MEKLLYISAFLFIFCSCNHNIDKAKDNQKGQTYNLVVEDPSGKFNGRKVAFEIISKYESGASKEIAFYIDDTTLFQTLLENGIIIKKTTAIKNDLKESLYYNDNGILVKKYEYLKNDSIPDLIKETTFKDDGAVDAEGLRGKDSLFLGVWTVHINNDTIEKFDNGFNPTGPPDTGYVYYRKKLIGLKIRTDNNSWKFEKR